MMVLAFLLEEPRKELVLVAREWDTGLHVGENKLHNTCTLYKLYIHVYDIYNVHVHDDVRTCTCIYMYIVYLYTHAQTQLHYTAGGKIFANWCNKFQHLISKLKLNRYTCTCI